MTGIQIVQSPAEQPSDTEEIDEDIEYDDDFDSASDDGDDILSGQYMNRHHTKDLTSVPIQEGPKPHPSDAKHIEDICSAMELERREKANLSRLQRLRELERAGIKKRIGPEPESYVHLDHWPESKYILLQQRRGSKFCQSRTIGTQSNDDNTEEHVQTILPTRCDAATEYVCPSFGDFSWDDFGGLRKAAGRILDVLENRALDETNMHDRDNGLRKLWGGFLPPSLSDISASIRVLEDLIAVDHDKDKLIGITITPEWLSNKNDAFMSFLTKHVKVSKEEHSPELAAH
ncbi:hypothetical protein FOL47_005329 [Perkinsus chesapeaki]|uniref:Uncharacterized protein n=1 Tax=Perkinsus chesapeaki TaxID=330153 RepID=A0A7J6LXJ7_PERCH|nr:hypothetical protein FOL47_005329 [Perkinsus chesapeaki]